MPLIQRFLVLFLFIVPAFFQNAYAVSTYPAMNTITVASSYGGVVVSDLKSACQSANSNESTRLGRIFQSTTLCVYGTRSGNSVPIVSAYNYNNFTSSGNNTVASSVFTCGTGDTLSSVATDNLSGICSTNTVCTAPAVKPLLANKSRGSGQGKTQKVLQICS